MDEARRRTLLGTKQFITRNLYYSDFLHVLDNLEQEYIITENHVQIIKAEKTENERIGKFLNILAKRGPDAFEAFVDSLKDGNRFIADKLLKDLETELAKSKEGERGVNRSMTSSNETLNSLDMNVQTLNLCTKCLEEIGMATMSDDPSTNHSSAQISPMTKDKSVSTEETNQWAGLNGSHDRWQRMNTQHSEFLQGMMQESFTCWYAKLKLHLTSRNMREPSFESPEPVTYAMVDSLLDQLINEVEKCFRALGAKDRYSLLTHVLSLKDSKKKLKELLKDAQEQKNKYADALLKQQNKNMQLNAQIKKKDKEIEKQNADKKLFQELIHDQEAQLNKLGKENQEMREELAATKDKLSVKEEENERLTAQQEDMAKLIKQLREVTVDMRAYKHPRTKFEYLKPSTTTTTTITTTGKRFDNTEPVQNSVTGTRTLSGQQKMGRTTKMSTPHPEKSNSKIKPYPFNPQIRISGPRAIENEPKGLVGLGIKGIGKQ